MRGCYDSSLTPLEPQPWTHRIQNTTRQQTETTTTSYPTADFRVRLTLGERDADRVIVIGVRTSGPAVFRRVDLEARTITDVEHAIESTPFMKALADFDERRAVVISEDELYVLDKQTLQFTEVSVVDTDPRTGETLRLVDQPRWYDVGSVPGVAWAVGTGVLARIVPTPDGLVAERYWWLRNAEVINSRRSLRTVRAYRGDRIATALKINSELVDFHTGQLLGAGSDCPAGPGETRVSACLYERFVSGIDKDSPGKSENVAGIVGPVEAPMFIYTNDASRYRPGGPRVAGSLTLPTSAVDLGDGRALAIRRGQIELLSY